VTLEQGLPTWGTYLPTNRFEVKNRRKRYIYILFISKYSFIYQWILFSKIIIGLLLKYLLRHKDLYVLLKFQWILLLLNLFVIRIEGYMLICRNAEGVHRQRNVGNPCSREITMLFNKKCKNKVRNSQTGFHSISGKGGLRRRPRSSPLNQWFSRDRNLRY